MSEEEYADIIRTAEQGNDTVEFDMICKFKLDYRNDKAPKLEVEDWIYKPSSKGEYNPFGF